METKINLNQSTVRYRAIGEGRKGDTFYYTRTHNVSFTLSIAQNRTCDRKGPGPIRNSLYRYLVFGFPVIDSINIYDESQLMKHLTLEMRPNPFTQTFWACFLESWPTRKHQTKTNQKDTKKHTKKKHAIKISTVRL